MLSPPVYTRRRALWAKAILEAEPQAGPITVEILEPVNDTYCPECKQYFRNSHGLKVHKARKH